jgi:hypothetical protein
VRDRDRRDSLTRARMADAMTASPESPQRFEPRLVAALDEPVRRYFAHAVRAGAPLGTGVRLTMSRRIKVGVWLPFTATQDCDGHSFVWRARVGWRGLTPLTVVDRHADGTASTDGRLLGRATLFHIADEDTTRSGAGRAALESVWAPASLLAQCGVSWRAESDELIVASWDVPPERPEVRLHIDEQGAVRSVSALRWGSLGQKAFDYVPCGCEVRAERRFGDFVVPSSVTVGWWFDTPRYAPFFKADVSHLELLR